MDTHMQPRTKAGARLVELAEEHAKDFATRAAQHDADNTVVAENFEAMKRTGILAAAVPTEFGGLGVESLHDLMVATSRLARACPSTAIAANMHIAAMWSLTAMWRRHKAAGDRRAERLDAMLPMLGSGQIVVCATGTEAGTSLFNPLTTATKVDGGYVINGRKIFCTNSEVADLLNVTARIDGRIGAAILKPGAAGLDVRRDWDALGMRGSGSGDIVLTDCFVSADRFVTTPSQVGEWHADGPGLIGVNYPLIGAYIGIAERAREIALHTATTSRKAPATGVLADKPAVRHLVAQIEVALCAARAALARTGVLMDEYFESHDMSDLDRGDLETLVADWQCSKLVVNRAARDVVDAAMTIVGGASYLSRHELSRLYRDVRAGSFHQPFSPVDAYEFVGRVAVGMDAFAGM